MIHRPELPSQILKRSVAIDRQKTSLSLEAAFWLALTTIGTGQAKCKHRQNPANCPLLEPLIYRVLVRRTAELPEP
jgi:hypothetical protein